MRKSECTFLTKTGFLAFSAIALSMASSSAVRADSAKRILSAKLNEATGERVDRVRAQVAFFSLRGYPAGRNGLPQGESRDRQADRRGETLCGRVATKVDGDERVTEIELMPVARYMKAKKLASPDGFIGADDRCNALVNAETETADRVLPTHCKNGAEAVLIELGNGCLPAIKIDLLEAGKREVCVLNREEIAPPAPAPAQVPVSKTYWYPRYPSLVRGVCGSF